MTSLPDWSEAAIADTSLPDPLKAQAEWNGEVYKLLVELSSFSLSEYSEQVHNLDKIAVFAQRALRLAQQAKPLTQSLNDK